MGRLNRFEAIHNERGIALPMAMMTLVLMTTLMLAFAVLSQTEPVIAANQLRVSQARAQAESGFEYASWALLAGNVDAPNPVPAGAIANPMPASPPGAPFSGATWTSNGTTGGFLVTVVNDPAVPPDPNIRQITSIGWTPNNNPADVHTKAHRMIQAKVLNIPNLAKGAPCALCVKGELSVGGNSTINGTNLDPACGDNNKWGTFTQGQTQTAGSASVTGGAGGVAQNQPASAFDGFTFTNTTLDQLKLLAKKSGTYFGPGFSGATAQDGTACPTGPTNKQGCASNGAAWSGYTSFNSSNKVANGIVFIDTTDGVDLTDAGTNTDTMAYLDIHGNPFSGGSFSGYMVVNGSINISGNMVVNGLVYAQNDLTYNGTGTGAINGLAVSRNIRDTSATSIDSDTTGNSRINFNCANTQAPQFNPKSFLIVPGTYRELSD
jgi:hypothetical protein